jgi:hypothetical protein
MQEQFGTIQRGIERRQEELNRVTDILALSGQRLMRLSSLAKALLVLLGALAASRAAWDEKLGQGSDLTLVVFTLLGIAVAVVAGLEAAFKVESRAAGLNALAADCQAGVRELDTKWRAEVGIAEGEQKLRAATDLLQLQGRKLDELQRAGSALGVNVTLKVRELEESAAGERKGWWRRGLPLWKRGRRYAA